MGGRVLCSGKVFTAEEEGEKQRQDATQCTRSSCEAYAVGGPSPGVAVGQSSQTIGKLSDISRARRTRHRIETVGGIWQG